MNNNNPQAGERGGGGKEFCSRSDRVDDEGEKEEFLGKIPRYTYLTLTPPYNLLNWLDLQYLVQPDLASYHVSIMPCHKLHYVCHNV